MAKQAQYNAYWCAALPGTKVPENNGYLFGGFYTSKESNPLTLAKSCPKYYTPLKMLEDVVVCVSDSYETARDNSLSFAGFESCTTGNPLATNSTDPNRWPHDCPPHYTPQLVTVDGDCEVNFCVHHNAFGTKSLLPIKLPPFRKHAKLKANVTHTLSLVTHDGDVWMKNESGHWYIKHSGPDSGESLLIELGLSPPSTRPEQGVTEPSNQSPQNLSNGVVATLSVFSTLAIGAVVLGAFIIGKRIQQAKKRSDYYQLDESRNQENVTEENV